MKRLLLICAAALALYSCQNAGKENVTLSGEMDVILQTGRWNYISLEEEKVVGVSDLGDEKADSEWAARDDWDFAVCDSLLRTNKGTMSAESFATTVPDSSQEIW